MVLSRARQRTSAVLVLLLLALGVTAVQTGAVPVPGITHTPAAHADEAWIPCIIASSSAGAEMLLIGLKADAMADEKFVEILVEFGRVALLDAATAWECLKWYNEDQRPPGSPCTAKYFTNTGSYLVTCPNPYSTQDG